jgi:hypothetical protein
VNGRGLLEVLEEINAAINILVIRTASVADGQPQSSVEIKTSTRGYDISVKAYVNSPVREAGDAAMDEFVRVHAELSQRLMGQ